MKRSFKKLTAWLCCMAMLISFIPATALPVFADEAEPVELTQELAASALASGEYYLSGDLALAGGLTFAKNAEVTIDLAGNDITGTVYPLLTVSSGKVTVTDSTATGTPGTDYVSGAIVGGENASTANYGMITVNGGEFVLDGGKLTGYNYTGASNRGGAVTVMNAAVFTMEGGEISGNKANRGAGVYLVNNAVFNMNDGAITGNISSGYGGGVQADYTTTVNINGGIITGNTGTRGNEICMGEGNANTLNITGGTVATTLTGAYDGIYSHTGDVTISGGKIDRIYWRGGSVTVSGGEIGTFTSANAGAGTDGPTFAITGNPVIESLSIGADTKVASIGELTEGASVYFAAWGTAGVLQMDGTVATNGRLCTYQKPTVPTSGTVAAGEYTLENDLVLTNTLTIAADTEVTIDLAGNTISMPDKDAGYFTVNGKLTITDNVGGGKVQFKETASYAGITLNAGSTFVLDDGELNGWVRAGAGAMMNMYEGSTFIMNNGLITDCRANNQPVIRPFGAGLTVEINGGAITGNNSVAGNIIGLATGTDALPNTLTISGDAVVAGNTMNDAPWNAGAYEIQTLDTIITVADEAEVGFIYGESTYSAEDTTYVTEMNISGAPTVHGIRWSAGARFTIYISELTEGANIKTANGGTISVKNLDETVAVEAYDNSATSGVASDKGNIYSYKVPTYAVTVNQVAGGTVEVDVTEGAEGTTVTVTATPDEGYELEAILVNGEAIDGNTFAIEAGDNVVTATFVAVDVSLPTSGVVAPGEYVLEEDLALTGWLTIRDEVVIDLAGHTITAGEGGNVFALDKAESKLTIKDSFGGGKIVSGASVGNPAVFLQGAGAQFTLDGGEITGWNREGGAGGMIYLLAGTTFTMNDGKLTGTSGANASLIRTGAGESTITINGGEISGNSDTAYGPIYLASGVTMNVTGGTFTNNTAATEGGVFRVAPGATLNISGGEFVENTAKNGGVIYNEGTVVITDGTFVDNEGTTAGGAIQILKGSTTTITGGIFVGNASARGGAIGTGENVVTENLPVLTIGGEAVIEENICTEYGGNLYLYTPVLTINGGTIGTAIKGEEVFGKSASANNWVRGNAASSVTITGGDISGLTVTAAPTTISGNPVIGEINATMTMSNLTSGAKIRTAGLNMVTVAEDDETVYTENDRDYVFAGDVVVEPEVFSVTVGEVANGTVTVDPAQGEAGTTVTVTATAAEGYELTAILVDGEAIEGNTFAITGDHVVTATFAEKVVEPTGLPTAGTVAAGEYVLEGDHVLTNTLSFKNDVEVVIDLAGYTISMPEKDSYYFDIAAGSKLTIKDSFGGGKVQFKNTTSYAGINVNGTFVLEGGELTGWSRINDGAYGAGGFINLWAGATVKMTGGKITGADCHSATVMRSQSAGGITVEITGGEISGHHAQGGSIIQINGTATNPSYLTIGGDAYIGDNTYGANNVPFAMTGTGHEIQVLDTHVTVTDEAVVGCIYGDGTDGAEAATGSFTITGAPVVASLRWSKGAETPASITDLTEGAEIKSLGACEIDGTVERTVEGNVYIYTWLDPATVVHKVTIGAFAGGTLTVDPAEGVIGTTVTVTAEAAEGYELVAILVDGEAIEGNTFAITGDHVVTANFAAVDVSLPTSGQVASGEYVLEGDHVLTGTLVFKGETVIDLAGNTITADAGRCFFNIPAGGHLTIKDSAGGGVVEFLEMTSSGGISLTGTFTLEGGELTGWSRVEEGVLKTGGFIDMFANATFEMTGGVITGISAAASTVLRSHGAGVTVDITGGEIVGNESTNGSIIQVGKAGGQSWLHIGGEAVILENTMKGEAVPFNWDAINATETIVTIDGYAFVEANINATLGTSENAVALESSQINISGAPYVQYVRADSASKTLVTITELEEGAEIHTSYGFTVADGNKDASVAVEAWNAESGNANEQGKIYTWQDPETVYTITVGEVANGTVTVDPTEGLYGTTVTVTAEAAEGYELTAILVDGKAINGNTFTITGDHEVTATFAEIVEIFTITVGEVANGTVTVDPAEGAAGTTVTVTATAAEGYELTAILVDGEAIEGNTFAITGNHVVTATFAEKVVEPEGLPTSGVVAAGEYVLEEDLTLTAWLTIRDEVVIDLAGHTITAGEGGNAFLLDKEASNLTIKDSFGGGKVQSGASTGNPAIFLQGAGAQFTLDGGEITGWNREGGAGGMVYLLAGTSFTMNGGKLTGASCAGNAIIRTGAGESTITINGGEISGNSVTGNAPISLASGVTMNITDGVFTGNTAGGYGLIHVGAGATLNISGGEFTENTANNGGVIYNEGTVAITGGTFADNEAATAGGAIQILKGSTTTITGGTFTGNSSKRGGAIGTGENVVAENLPVLTIGGDVVIEENICTEYGGNLYLYTPVLTINGGTIGTAIKGEDVVGKSASANNWVRGNATTSVTITGGDISGLTVSNAATAISGNPVIGEINATMTMSNLTSGAKIRTAGLNMVTEADETVYTTNDRDFYFKGDMGLADKFVPGATVTLTEATSVNGTIVLAEAGEYTLDLAGYTLSGTVAPYFTVAAGAKLTIVDSSAEQTGKVMGLAAATAPMFQVNGEFVLNAGTITGHGANVVVLGKDAAMTMNGGEISGNTAARGAITSGDVAASNVTFTMNGGTIKDNICTQRGANLYFYDPAMVTITGDAVVGAAYVKDAEGNLTETTKDNIYQNVEIRGGNVAISGTPSIKFICLSKGTAGVAGTVTGAPVVEEMMTVNAAANVTIGALATGASIPVDTKFALKGTGENGAYDATVNAQARLYRYAGDVKSILFVANSFGGDTINYMTKLGNFFGIEVDPAGLYVGSQNIRWHAQSLAESLRNTDLNGDGVIGDSRQRTGDGLYTCAGFEGYVDIPTVLEGKKWDYVVLQQGVEYVGFEGTYNSDVDFLLDYIADVQPDAKVYFSQTWAVDNRSWSTQVNPDAPESVEAGGQWVNSSSYLTQFGGSQEAMYDAILRNTDLYFAGDDARFEVDGYLPIGIAVQTMRQNYTDTYLTRDGFHLSKNAGRMIAGLATLKTLFPDIDLSKLTAADMAGMFDADSDTNVHLNDAFEATDANVATLLAAVETACGYAAADTVPAYGDGTANKQFNPDGAAISSNEYVAVYENVTEVGQVPVRVTDGAGVAGVLKDSYASTGAGKIVIYKNGVATSVIDELWLEANAGIVLTNRYENLDGTYYVIADPQAPQLAVVSNKLYMTFTVMLYTDDGNIINGGVYFTTSADGVTWTKAVKVSDAPMAYGLTALTTGNLLLSVADTSTKVLTLTTAGAVTSTVELDASVADVAFAEADANVYAVTSNGAIYVSTDKGATWTATAVAAGAMGSPDMVMLHRMCIYVTWSDEAERDIYGKVWTIDLEDETGCYGWNNSEVEPVVEDYALATAYAGKSTAGQPASFKSGSNVKTVYADGGEVQSVTKSVVIQMASSVSLKSSMVITFKVPSAPIDAQNGSYAKIIRVPADGSDPVETIVEVNEDVLVNNVYEFPYSGISARKMGDVVYFAIYNDKGEQITMMLKQSIKDYAMSQLASTSDTNLRTLLVDMLNYGAAAQVEFEYAVDKLVNADLTEEQKSWASEELVLDENLTNKGYVNATKPSAKSLVLVNVIEINIKYMASQVPTASYAKISYTNHGGNPYTGTVELVDGVTGTANTPVKIVSITTLAPADIYTPVTIELYDGNDQLIDGSTLVYTMATYAYNVVSGDKELTDSLSVLSMRIVQLGLSARKYFSGY